ncbi:5'-3' exoribonuclease 3-like [Silene latifolia]|uniref:5'-3' exoribonuclease 3-like n=1 Tax=Silene latifolia TaxID=37657 RepID=UPI003D77F5FB
MGVPAFYSWLIGKYPNVKASFKEETNDLEFDHLYLDMNGIIHPCFHPDSLMFPPTTFEEVFENIYVYIDRLFSIVRPRKLLYLAIDGVAPRAKLNQQRSRRFRTAKDNELAEEEEKILRAKYERMGKKVLPVLESRVSDSNVITPGTEFMFELSNALKSYIVKRLENDPGWKDIKVILSDATVPGEGEHKIMSFIRNLRSLPEYNPNTRHCLYGLDADLIMLALATHEIHFSILREYVGNVPDQKPDSESSLVSIIKIAEAVVYASDKSTEQGKKWFDIQDKSRSMAILPQNFEFVHVWILREYLEFDMQITDPPEKFVFDIERIVDDFIFLCLFVGNDFLPHMPTLEIRENGIGLLMHVYKNEFKNFGGYLVDMERVNEAHVSFIKLKRVEKFILSVGSYEEKIFRKRTALRDSWLRKLSNIERSRKDEEDEQSSDVCISDAQCPKVSTSVSQHSAIDLRDNPIPDIEEMVKNTKELKEELKSSIRNNSDIFKDGVICSDKVKLGLEGWKKRYYKEKFSVDDPKETELLRKELVEKYTEGLCWVLMYYFSGIPSWNWYYPHYYGLFASELKGLSQVKVKFHKGSPFKPFDQLMAVLPPKSAHALPEAYQNLMISSDSEIVEFYPKDFEVDMDGKRFTWQGISKLPFIDQEKLLNATRQLETKITMNEAKRNVEMSDYLFWMGSNSCAEITLDYIIPNSEKKVEFENVVNAQDPIMCCNFKLPVANVLPPRFLEGVQLPEKTVSENDIEEIPIWHEWTGRQPGTRTQVQQCSKKVGTDEAMMHKHAGTGWSGAGRGNGNSNISEPYSNRPQNQQSYSGYGQSSRFGASRGSGNNLNISEPYSNRPQNQQSYSGYGQSSRSGASKGSGNNFNISAPYGNRPQNQQSYSGYGKSPWSGNGNNFNISEPYSNRSQNQESQIGYGQSSNATASRGWFKQHPLSVPDSNRSTMSTTCASNVNTRLGSLRISPPEANYRGGGQTGSIWPSRNVPNSHQNPTWQSQRPTWRPSNANPGCTSVGRGRGRGYDRHNSDSERDPRRW